MATQDNLDDDAGSQDIQAVSRAGHILSLFGTEAMELTAAEVAERTGLNRSTAYRYCASLVAAGMMDRGRRRGSFTPGGMILQLGIAALSRRQVVELAPRRLAQLSDATHTTSVLSLWGVTGPVITRVHESMRRTMVVTVRVGAQLDLTAAQTKIFLAFHPDQLAMERLTAYLPVESRTSLEAEIEQIRSDGICVVDEEDGLVGAAVPIFDEYGICATVALLGTERMTDFSPGSSQRRHLLSCATALSGDVGGEKHVRKLPWGAPEAS